MEYEAGGYRRNTVVKTRRADRNMMGFDCSFVFLFSQLSADVLEPLRACRMTME